MTNTLEQLAAIGFGGTRQEPACWRITRLDASVPRRGTHGIEPACSAALLSWRKLLRLSGRNSPYRITRAER